MLFDYLDHSKYQVKDLVKDGYKMIFNLYIKGNHKYRKYLKLLDTV